MSILGIIAALFILIGGHEFGHFWVARRFGVKTLRFSIGFGKVLWRWQGKDNTEYVFCLFPLGGYIKLLDQREAPVTSAELPYAFDQQPLYKRTLIVLAGPAFNVLLAIAAYWIVFMLGVTQPMPIIEKTLPASPAAQANIMSGTQIIAIDQQRTPTWPAVIISLVPYLGETHQLSLTLQSPDGKITHPIISLQHWRIDSVLRPDLLKSLGLVPWQPQPHQPWPKTKLHTRQYSPWIALTQASREVWLYGKFNLVVIKKLCVGDLSIKSLMGPVGLFQSTALAAQQGIVPYLALLGFISISLAIINLFPLPGLDGSQLIYFIIEKFRHKPVALATQQLLFRLGIIALSVLMVQTLMNDLLRSLSFH